MSTLLRKIKILKGGDIRTVTIDSLRTFVKQSSVSFQERFERQVTDELKKGHDSGITHQYELVFDPEVVSSLLCTQKLTDEFYSWLGDRPDQIKKIKQALFGFHCAFK